jgi:methyl-accepting chemotaxis protein
MSKTTKPQPAAIEPAPLPVDELVARFQIETEAALGALRAEFLRIVTDQERKVAGLADEWTRTRSEVTELRKGIEDAIHRMNEAVKEALVSQRESSRHASTAQNAAAVFEKLRAAQPDIHRMVSDQNKVIASARDQLTHLGEQLNAISKRLDEFDVVAEDYEDTKGAVRGMDLIVKDLKTESTQRRQVGGRSS